MGKGGRGKLVETVRLGVTFVVVAIVGCIFLPLTEMAEQATKHKMEVIEIFSPMLEAIGNDPKAAVQDNLMVILSAVGTLLSIIIVAQVCWRHSHSKESQREKALIEAILLMLPLYAVCSFMVLLLSEMPSAANVIHLLEATKEIYEAVVLHEFLELMYSYSDISRDKPIPKALLGRHVHFGPPLDWFIKDVKMDEALVKRLEGWTMQFVYFRPFHIVFDLVVVHMLGYHWVGNLTFAAYMVSTTYSLSSLIGFYHTFAKELQGVVFLTTYQKMGLALIPKLDQFQCFFNLEDGKHCNVDVLIDQLASALVCIEMGFLFSFAFQEAFSIKWLNVKAATTKKED
mmetsp:Transcript_57838/g.159676  ORF Transcript_57838/g.159676 Transcript_57838/m.159676 type:complete len:343 (+) Transcript_57838:96-1124(+)